MFKREGVKILFLSSFIMVLCLLIISLGTYSLFSNTTKVSTHLKAGVLNVELKRTNLVYNELDQDGFLVLNENNEIKDFTKSNYITGNIFDISNDDVIVPGSFYEAKMVLTNNGNVAFDYWIEVNLKEELDTSLEKQIKITVFTYVDKIEIETSCFLKEGLLIGTEQIPLDSVLIGEEKTFTIRAEFIDSNLNNLAMEEEVNFDLTVYAVQKVNK